MVTIEHYTAGWTTRVPFNGFEFYITHTHALGQIMPYLIPADISTPYPRIRCAGEVKRKPIIPAVSWNKQYCSLKDISRWLCSAAQQRDAMGIWSEKSKLWSMRAIHKMAATLGDFPAARALRGNFYGQPGLPHLAKHFFPGFLVLLPVKKPHTNENLSGLTPPRHNADFCFHRATITDTKRSERTCLCRQPIYYGRAEAPLAQVFRKDRTDFDARGDTTIARVPVCLQPPGRLLVERWRLSISCSFRCLALTVVHMYKRVSQVWQMRGGRKTVTKANNRQHKARTAKTLGVEPFSVGKTKENKTQAKVSLAADNRSPCRRSAVLYRCSESCTAHYHRSGKIEISCSNSCCGLIFQVLRTQTSSVSITLTVSKQKEQKVAFRRWVFLGRMQPAIHPTCTRCAKVPRRPRPAPFCE